MDHVRVKSLSVRILNFVYFMICVIRILHDRDVAAPGPDLRALLAVPAPAHHVFPRRHNRHLDAVDDGEISRRVAAPLPVGRHAALGVGGARRQLLGVVPAVEARVREANVAGLVAPVVLVAAGRRRELWRLLVALPHPAVRPPQVSGLLPTRGSRRIHSFVVLSICFITFITVVYKVAKMSETLRKIGFGFGARFDGPLRVRGDGARISRWDQVLSLGAPFG